MEKSAYTTTISLRTRLKLSLECGDAWTNIEHHFQLKPICVVSLDMVNQYKLPMAHSAHMSDCRCVCVCVSEGAPCLRL